MSHISWIGVTETKNGVSGICGPITRGIIVSSESQKEGRECRAKEVFTEKPAENFPNLVKGIKLQIQETIKQILGNSCKHT